jgi:phosphoribosylformylglycinamidine synthase subunit PurQ / glutaminase
MTSVNGAGARLRIGVVTFPGSLDDGDARRAVRLMGGEAVRIWHADDHLHGAQAVILPGGFSYGDYLRTGAIARFAPAMSAVVEFARQGGPVLGVCNGFQILCEAGLLPGALIRNRSLRFVCRWVHVRAEGRADAAPDVDDGEVLHVPVKHGEGQWVASHDELERVEALGLVAFRYCGPDGRVEDRFNPNGSTNAIAGLRNEGGNVIGLMPHPEHAVESDLGPTGGQAVFQWLMRAARRQTAVASGAGSASPST